MIKEMKKLRYAKAKKLKGEIRGISRQMYKEKLLSDMAYYKSMYRWKLDTEFKDAYMLSIKQMLDMDLAGEEEAEFYRNEFYTKTEYTH